MGSGLPIFLLITCLQVLVIEAVTDSSDCKLIYGFPSRILTGMGLSGTLTGDIGDFPELQTLDPCALSF
ncbi:hypothetical protein OIU74_011940 [Salix koriyanagi]|uniref:Uncharacterized protein n=1 Tax=Salix koriyanagi TaxID=2511006 RepID=A0A9Q0Q5V3_9ROSI|nr:hypothetical protein OIU74_011940 [Salix koriyanagi]